jgi:hypothetical protein
MCFLFFFGWYGQQVLKAACFPCATTMLLGYAWKSLWIIAILLDCTWSSLLSTVPLHSYKHWVHLVLWRLPKSFWWKRNAVTFTVSSIRFHCWSLEHNNSALFFVCDLVWFSRGYFQEKLDGCSVSSGVLSSSLSQSREKLLVGVWNRQTFTVTHWTNSQWYIWVLHGLLFLLSNPFLNREHHTEVSVRHNLSALSIRWGLQT